MPVILVVLCVDVVATTNPIILSLVTEVKKKIYISP